MGISVCSDSDDASVASASVSVPDPVVVSAMASGGCGDEDMIASVFVIGDGCCMGASGVQVSCLKLELCIWVYFCVEIKSCWVLYDVVGCVQAWGRSRGRGCSRQASGSKFDTH